MKKTAIAFVTILSLNISCNDVLKQDPKDRLASSNFYKSRSDAIAAVYAIYDPIQGYSGYGGNNWEVQFIGVTDYAIGTGIYAPLSQYVLDSGSIGRTDAAWRVFYQSIKNANIALEKIPDIDMENDEKNALLGEARFLRAFAYLNLVKGWGGVPLRKEPPAADSFSEARASIAEVYDLIISDLEFAETNLPPTQSLAGRPTNWAAKTMLADVYLFRENWTEARDKADEVINSGAYSLVEVSEASDFERIFGPTANTSSEDIFSLKYTRTQGTVLPRQYAMPNSAYSAGGYGSFYGRPTFPLLNNWDQEDLRYQFDIYTSYPTYDGEIVQNPPERPILFGKFKDPGFAPSHGNDFPIYRYPDVLLIYAEAASQENDGPTSMAIERLNMVHRRAYGYNPDETSPVDFTQAEASTAQSFRDLVLRERAYEFLCEGKRWFDLIRTGRVKEVIQEAKGIDVPDSFLLFPIPIAEIDNNSEIGPEDQNPGY